MKENDGNGRIRKNVNHLGMNSFSLYVCHKSLKTLKNLGPISLFLFFGRPATHMRGSPLNFLCSISGPPNPSPLTFSHFDSDFLPPDVKDTIWFFSVFWRGGCMNNGGALKWCFNREPISHHSQGPRHSMSPSGNRRTHKPKNNVRLISRFGARDFFWRDRVISRIWEEYSSKMLSDVARWDTRISLLSLGLGCFLCQQ